MWHYFLSPLSELKIVQIFQLSVTLQAVWQLPKNTSTKNKSNKKTAEAEYGIRKGFWLHSALALLALYSLYAVIIYISGTGHLPVSVNPLALLDPVTSSLLIVIFTLLYFYATARKVPISNTAKIAAYVLVVAAALALLIAVVVSSQHSSASDDFYFRFWVLFHNPYVSALVSAASLVGSVAVVASLVRSQTGR